MKTWRVILISVLPLVITGCSLKPQVMDGDGMIRETENTAELSFESFDGGGPDFDVVIGDENEMTPDAFLTVRIADTCFSADPADNASAEAFFERLRSENLEVLMEDNGGFEKVGELPWDLPQNDEKITAEPGDIVLYQGNRIAVYYDEAASDLTRLGRLNADPEEIREVFGGKDEVTAEFFMEWTE